jgi:hypothetical protein
MAMLVMLAAAGAGVKNASARGCQKRQRSLSRHTIEDTGPGRHDNRRRHVQGLALVRKSAAEMVATTIRTAFAQQDPALVREQWW